MLNIIILVAVLLGGTVQSGKVAYYSESWDFGRIAAYRGLAIPEHYIGIAHWDCAKLGMPALLYIAETGPWPAYVVDCTQREHIASVRDTKHIVAEVPYYVKELVGFDGLAQGKIIFTSKRVVDQIAPIFWRGFWTSSCDLCQ